MMVNLNTFKISPQNKTSSEDLPIPWYHWHLILTGLDMAQSRLHVLYLGNKGPISGGWDVWLDIWRMCSTVHLDGGFEKQSSIAVRVSPFRDVAGSCNGRKRWGPIQWRSDDECHQQSQCAQIHVWDLNVRLHWWRLEVHRDCQCNTTVWKAENKMGCPFVSLWINKVQLYCSPSERRNLSENISKTGICKHFAPSKRWKTSTCPFSPVAVH